ncbi:pentatricopeptide repeat-containing protein 1, mitochondrial [Prorops nasuta]|uniref:pentatricopeptide repeat-containing protein 1, mitochondrial n=1 Tax=Prorops nasuta TaxID=863751 RepID=UPI0034CE0863
MFSTRVNSIYYRYKTLVLCLPDSNFFKQKYSSKRFCSYFKAYLSNNDAMPYQHFSLKPLKIESFLRKSFCTFKEPKDPDRFGDYAHINYEEAEMDEKELKEEVFRENEVRTPRWKRLSPGQYGQLIKTHISKKDLNAAIEVLSLIKENRDKPTTYMFNLLIRAYSLQGDLKMCFKLYNKIKEYALVPNAATYTSLFNVCANAEDKMLALMKLDNLRRYLYQKNIILNDTNYHAMIKAYSRHNETLRAFEIADEMRENRIEFTDITYNSLLNAAISDKEAGLKFALYVWHTMLRSKIKPTVITYNLLLTAIKDTNFGDLDVDQLLLPGVKESQIIVEKNSQSNLLSKQPALNTLLIESADTLKDVTVKTGSGIYYSYKEETQLVPESNHENKLQTKEEILTSLNKILQKNRLILFGGIEGIFSSMKENDILPNVKTVSILLELIPNTKTAEEAFLKQIHKNKVELDICFFNLLIYRRSKRLDYESAKEVLYLMQQRHLKPDIMTFGVLALGCTSKNQGDELLQSMSNIGFSPNIIIITTLLKNALNRKKFVYAMDLMKYLKTSHIKPNDKLFETLDEFVESTRDFLDQRGRYRNFKVTEKVKENIIQFIAYYSKWRLYMEKISTKTRDM